LPSDYAPAVKPPVAPGSQLSGHIGLSDVRNHSEASWLPPFQDPSGCLKDPFSAELSSLSSAHRDLLGWMPHQTSATFNGRDAQYDDLSTWLPVTAPLSELASVKCRPSERAQTQPMKLDIDGTQRGEPPDHRLGITASATPCIAPRLASLTDPLHRVEELAILALQGVSPAFSHLRQRTRDGVALG